MYNLTLVDQLLTQADGDIEKKLQSIRSAMVTANLIESAPAHVKSKWREQAQREELCLEDITL